MADSRTELVNRFFSGTGPTYDHIADVCTFGFDRFWKRRIMKRIPDRLTRVMDLACGTGILTFQIAQRFPNSHVTGVELRDEYLDIAREKAKALRIANVDFILSRAEDVLLEEPLDCITGSYLAKYADLPTLVGNVERMLRGGGLFLMHDFTYPTWGPFAWIWQQHFRILRTVGSWRYPRWQTIFYELPELIRRTRWVAELTGLLKKHTFSDITMESLTFGTSAIIVAKK
jgi:demethylmenaquinone methyltransferase/2-methoxy-6-polyprenyl-1,4-benzoquinol methylase